jgi:hypothetical protein
MKVSVIVLLSSVLLARLSFAATFYVATDGDDSNDCAAAQSPSTPKRNIMGANGGIACLAASDTLDIRAGNYDEIVMSHLGTTFPSGTESQPITIQGHSGETVTTRRWGFHSGATIQYWMIKNIIVDDQNDNGDSNNGFYVGNSNDHMTLKNAEIKNASCNGIQGGAAFVEIINVDVHDNGSNCPSSGGHASGVGYGIYWWGTNTLFEKMKVHGNHGYGFHIYDTGSDSVSNNVVRDSRIYSNAGPEGGIGLLLSSGSNNEAYGNFIYNNEGGVQVDYDCTDCLIYNNTIYNNSPIGEGIVIGSSVVRAIVKNNIVYGNQINGILDTGTSSEIVNNQCDSAATGCSIVGDPFFADPVNGDFTLLVGSPAKGAGTPYIQANISLPFTPDIGATLFP